MPDISFPINDRIAEVVWDHLVRTLYCAKNGFLTEQDEVIITSPYIRDIDNQHYNLRGPIGEVLSSIEARKYSKLTDILIAIKKSGIKVGLMTAPFGERFGKTVERYNKDETKMLKKLYRAGIEIRHHNSNHAKHIITPVGVLTGSFNNTQRALFWQVEQATIHTPPASQARLTSYDVWNNGRRIVP